MLSILAGKGKAILIFVNFKEKGWKAGLSWKEGRFRPGQKR